MTTPKSIKVKANGHDTFCLCDGCMKLPTKKVTVKATPGKPIWAGFARECGYKVNY